MNKVILMGRLVDDPEIYDTPEGDAVGMAKFRLAVERKYKKKNDDVTADFFSCIAFGRGAEFAEQYLRKGIKIAVVGRIENYSYKNQEGRKVFGSQIIVEEFEFAESKAASERSRGESDGTTGSAGSNRSSGRKVRQTQEEADEEYPPDDASNGGRRSAGNAGSRRQNTARSGSGSGRTERSENRQGSHRSSGNRRAQEEDRYADNDPYADYDDTDKPVFE